MHMHQAAFSVVGASLDIQVPSESNEHEEGHDKSLLDIVTEIDEGDRKDFFNFATAERAHQEKR
jgi:hypothetical protein